MRTNCLQVYKKALSVIGCFCALGVMAGNATWMGAEDGDPTKSANWSGTTGCGSLDDRSNRDTATFRGAPANTTIAPSQEWIIGTLLFSDYGGQAAHWQLGSGNLVDPPIRLAGIGSGYLDFSHAAGVTDFVVDLVGPFVASNNYQFSCNSTEPSNALKLGCINGKGEMQLKGAGNRGVIYGPLGDGEGGAIAVNKMHKGTWTIKGNNTFTGIVTINEGTLIVAGDVDEAGKPGPLGANSSYTGGQGVRVGNQNPTADGFSALLLGYNDDGTPVTFARETTSLANNKITTVDQKAHFGGANTNGVTKFTATVRSNRPSVLKCAAGGTVSFVGTFDPKNYAVAIGTEDFTGTVRFESSLSTVGGVTCAYGTLDMCAELKAATTVESGAALTSSSAANGKVTGALTVNAGGILAGVEGGLLQVKGDLSLAEGAVLRFPAAEREAPLITVDSELSLAGLKVRLDPPDDPPAERFPLLTANGGLADFDKIDASELPRHYKVLLSGNTLYGGYSLGLTIFVR